MAFNPLAVNSADLQRQLQTNNITSVQIVNEYLAQIDRHESTLNAFISIAPREILLKTAERLDEERQTGRERSPLHGIPIVLKVYYPPIPTSTDVSELTVSLGLLHHTPGPRIGNNRRIVGIRRSQSQVQLSHRAKTG